MKNSKSHSEGGINRSRDASFCKYHISKKEPGNILKSKEKKP